MFCIRYITFNKITRKNSQSEYKSATYYYADEFHFAEYEDVRFLHIP